MIVQLVPSELKVVHYLCLGLPNKEIALHLNISIKTVKNHLSSIYTKLGVQKRIQAIAIILNWRTSGFTPPLSIIQNESNLSPAHAGAKGCIERELVFHSRAIPFGAVFVR
jgi:DNA-binding CsgD family transcriptional regulator